MKLYISGAITNNPDYEVQFLLTKEKLSSEYNAIINPVEISYEVNKKINSPNYYDYMRADIKELIECDAIYMMKGWKSSNGAKLEHEIAKVLNLKIIYEV